MRSTLSGGNLLSSTAIYTVGDFLTTAVSGFLLIPLYLHFMTPADYGLYSTATVMINMLGVLLGLGLTSSVGRFYFIYRASAREYSYLGSVWLFQTLFALTVCAMLALWGKSLWTVITPEIPFRPYIWPVLGGALLAFSAQIYSLWLRVQERPIGFVILQLAGMAFFLGLLGVFLVFMKKGAYGTLTAAVGSNVLLAMISVGFLVRKMVWRIDSALLMPSLRFGGWMVVGTFGYFFLNKSQLFFLQHYGNLATVGIYNLGQQLGGVVTLLSISFARAWQPVIYSAPTKEDAAAAIARTSKWFVAAMVYATLGIALGSNELLRLLARPGYFGASVIIRLGAIGSFVYVLGTLTSAALLYQKRADLTQLAVLVSAGVNVLLNILLIPRFQMVGAALAMLISFTAMSVLGFYLAQKSLRVAYDWNALAKITGLAAIMLAGEWLMVRQVTGLATTSARVALLLAYPPILFVLGAFKPTEWKAFLAFGDDALKRVGLRRNSVGTA